MQSYTAIIIWAVVIGVAFIWAWRAGHIVKFRDYVRQTREELKKCTWPSWEELKGSTVVIFISILLLGGFTMSVDFIFSVIVRWMNA